MGSHKHPSKQQQQQRNKEGTNWRTIVVCMTTDRWHWSWHVSNNHHGRISDKHKHIRTHAQTFRSLSFLFCLIFLVNGRVYPSRLWRTPLIYDFFLYSPFNSMLFFLYSQNMRSRRLSYSLFFCLFLFVLYFFPSLVSPTPFQPCLLGHCSYRLHWHFCLFFCF